MSARQLKTLSIAFACAALLACSGVPVHMGLKKGERLPAGRSRDIASGACGFQVVFAYFPLGFALNGRLARAYEGLERQAAGDPITDVEIAEEWHYALVGTSYCTKLRARAIHPAPVAPAAAPAPAIPAPVVTPPVPDVPPAVPPGPPAAQPAPVAPASPAASGILEKGTSARLKPDGVLRTRPRPEGEPVEIDAGAAVQLGLHLRNENGSWWYVSSDGKSGWALEGDLEPMAP